MPRNRPGRTPPTPAELAERSVREFFDTLVGDPLVQDAEALDTTIGEVAEALIREHLANGGNPIDGGVSDRELFAQHAGYLVGVQVGLRLAGGLR